MNPEQDPGTLDVLARAEPDEPVFTLLGRDRHAPALVWLWATLRELDDEDPVIVQGARRIADRMAEWAATHDRKSVGMGQATLAGVFELIRAVNAGLKQVPPNERTGDEVFRALLAGTEIEAED